MHTLLIHIGSSSDDDLVAGISNWKQPIKQADGDSLTLYEHKPDSSEHRCDPIGDVYAGIVRPNNAVLAVATGHNSGLKSRQAASSAVRGCVEKLNETLLSESMPKTTRQMTAHILSSFGFAQEVIRKHEGATASLCVAVVCSLDRHWGHEQWGLCVVSVGSVSCFVWQNRTGIVYEVTSAGLRGATDVKGSLGTIVNGEPDLGGLMCSYVHVASNDVVFLATRGIYDNFDPQLNGTAVIEHVGSPTEVATDQPTDIHPSDSEKREERILRELTEVLRKRRARRKSDHLSALALKEALIEHVVEVTSEKRTFLDKSWQDMKYSYFLSEEERATMEKEIFQSADAHPGVLEHATVVAYQVGLLSENASHKRTNLFLYSPTISDLSIGDNEDESISEGQ